MPLTVTETPGAGANAFASPTYALAYAAYHIGGAAFVGLTADQRAQALVTAAREIAKIPLVGGSPWTWTEVPTWLQDANVELAMSYTPAFASGATPV